MNGKDEHALLAAENCLNVTVTSIHIYPFDKLIQCADRTRSNILNPDLNPTYAYHPSILFRYRMRLFRLVTLAVLAGLLEVPTAVARKGNNPGQYLSVSDPQAILKRKNVNKLTSAEIFQESQKAALAQRGGDGAGQKDAITGAIILTLIERGINKLFVAKGVKFPSMLGGCAALLFFLLLADLISPGLGELIFSSLSPGSALLAKWLPVFFVPGLAMLPLAPSVGNGLEVCLDPNEIFLYNQRFQANFSVCLLVQVAKILLVTILGWAFSLSTVASIVLFLRAAQGNLIKSPPPAPKVKKGKIVAAPKPYADETMSFLLKSSIITGIISVSATRMGNDFATPLRSLFLFLSTCATYVWGARLPSGFTKTVHPLVTSTALTLGIIHLTGMATGSSFIDVLKTYKVGSLDLLTTGAGDILLFLLGPSVVSFAIAMYSRRVLLKENFLIVASAMMVSSAGGLFGTAGFVKLIKLGGDVGKMIRLSVLSRNVTTALSMAIAAMLGGDISIAASVVVLTGIFGATYARRTLDAMGIYDPVTRGLAVGASSQGLGVSSLVSEADAFPFAAMAMVLTAVSATVLVSIAPIKEALINLAGP